MNHWVQNVWKIQILKIKILILEKAHFVGLHCVITVSFLFSLCVITHTVVTSSFGSMKLMNKWLNEYMNRQTNTYVDMYM